MESISLDEFIELRDSGINILDSRPTSHFSHNHIPFSIGISINGSFEYMVNCFFPEKDKIILISNKDRLSESLLRLESEDFLDIPNLIDSREYSSFHFSRIYNGFLKNFAKIK